MRKSKGILIEIASLAGIRINGDNPWDVKVYNEKVYKRILTQGALGLGESYMDGWWDCGKIDDLSYRINRFDLQGGAGLNNATFFFRILLPSILVNMQSKKRAFVIGEKHYDIGNQLFENMLDRRMVYSCAYWEDSNSLDDAQEKKMDLVCKKLKLHPGMKVLDIGCGWGSFARYAAEKYGVSVIGITVSKEQVELGKELCDGLPVEIRFQDYRDVDLKYDRVVSIGMFEHVGYKNYKTFMKTVYKCLEDDGLFLLHTIGTNGSVISDEWLTKYIFPGGMLPSIKHVGGAIEGLFVMEDWHNMSANYDKTLMAWYENFDRNWNRIKLNYDERFYRMWKYYLLSCAGAFRARRAQVWQIVLSKKGVLGGYKPVR